MVSPVEPLVPGSSHDRSELAERLAVARDPVVTEVTTKFLAQSRVLFSDRAMSIPLTPYGDRRDRSRKSARSRFAFDHPIPLEAKPPVMREPQEVESSRSLRTRHTPEPRSPEAYQTRFDWVERQSILGKTLRKVAVHSVTKIAEIGEIKINLFSASCRECREIGLDLALNPPICHRMDSYSKGTSELCE